MKQLIVSHDPVLHRPNIALKLVNRTGKQCRERFLNHLSPDIKRSPWTAEEDNIIQMLHSMLGNRWSKYVEHLPGKSLSCALMACLYCPYLM